MASDFIARSTVGTRASKLGYTFDKDLNQYILENNGRAYSKLTVSDQLTNKISKNKNIDGIFCVTDNIAIGAMEYLKSQGIKIPEDVSIVSIGDSKVSKVVTPKLSTVHYYYKTSGIEAAKIIINKMKYDNKDIDKIKLGYKYIKRESIR
mgnify:CR=1 FL=1